MDIFAPAKVNLTLHVTGQRGDGYHLLDSLVVFAGVGDHLRLQTGNALSVTTEGPEAGAVPADMDNLVLQVARLFPGDDMPGASFVLTKNLPVASGIGGGSADAAAAFRGLMCHWSGLLPGDDIPPDLFSPDQTPMAGALAGLGADIPVCLMSQAARMRGVGAELDAVHDLPLLWAVLVNPRVAVPTPTVFKGLAEKNNPAMPSILPQFAGAGELIQWLSTQRNDLERPALAHTPVIGAVLGALNGAKDCLLARMSGSGATCFGLFPDQHSAVKAAEHLHAAQPNWWIKPTWLGTATQAAQPRIS